MANLLDIRRRIRSVRNTQQITRAMKFVSAAKLKKAQQRVMTARPYARRMLQLIQHLALRHPDQSHPLLQGRGEQKILLLVLKAAYAFMAGAPGARVVMDLVGRKVYDHFNRRRYDIRSHYVDRLSHVDLELARQVTAPLMQGFLDGEADKVFVIYNQFKSAAQQATTVEQLLPIVDLGLEPPAEGAAPAGVDYIFDQPQDEIFRDLFPQHVVTQVYRALVESVASEHSARMTAMDAATKNAGDMIDRLVLTRNRIRQASITKEIIEIVSGAAALS
jgi:F-type H+-transporting ATPase subunit gamma